MHCVFHAAICRDVSFRDQGTLWSLDTRRFYQHTHPLPLQCRRLVTESNPVPGRVVKTTSKAIGPGSGLHTILYDMILCISRAVKSLRVASLVYHCVVHGIWRSILKLSSWRIFLFCLPWISRYATLREGFNSRSYKKFETHLNSSSRMRVMNHNWSATK